LSRDGSTRPRVGTSTSRLWGIAKCSDLGSNCPHRLADSCPISRDGNAPMGCQLTFAARRTGRQVSGVQSGSADVRYGSATAIRCRYARTSSFGDSSRLGPRPQGFVTCHRRHLARGTPEDSIARCAHDTGRVTPGVGPSRIGRWRAIHDSRQARPSAAPPPARIDAASMARRRRPPKRRRIANWRGRR
jgi:hypothetical protein